MDPQGSAYPQLGNTGVDKCNTNFRTSSSKVLVQF